MARGKKKAGKAGKKQGSKAKRPAAKRALPMIWSSP